MEDNDNGTYSKVFSAIPAGIYSFQVVAYTDAENVRWIGLDGGKDNFVISVAEDETDVMITYDVVNDVVTVDGATIVRDLEVNSVIAVGNGDGSWLNGIAWDPTDTTNAMTEVSDKVFEITFTDVEAFDNYQIKFAANGEVTKWTDNWGGVYEGSGIESDAVYNSNDNITVAFDYALADVTVRLDLTNFDYTSKQGAKFTVTVVDKTPKGPMIGDVDGDGEITIKDATMIQKLALGIGYPEDLQEVTELMAIADTNGDGYVTIVDATLVQKYNAGGYKNTGYVGVVAVG